MRVPISDMTFVVRSCGERTLPAAVNHLRGLVAQGGGDAAGQVHVVAERPFAKAVRRTFEIGLEARRPWVVGMDADVLLLGDGLERIGNVCAAADGAVFSVAGLVLCKMYGGFCFMGVHCYPRRLLERALVVAKDAGMGGAALRPESAVAKAMEAHGLRSFAPPVPLAIHDFEQWHRHIYVKMRMRGRRWAADGGSGSDTGFADHVAFVERRARADADYLIASWGLRDGFADAANPGAPAHYEWDGHYPSFNEKVLALGVAEKQPWGCAAIGLAECVVATHDFVGDQRTPRWIRERFGFSEGPAQTLRRIGIDVEALRRPSAPVVAGAAREAA